MAQAILLHTKLCKMYRVYCLNYILNESQVNIESIISVTSLLWCNQLFFRVSTTNQIFLNPPQTIEIHNTGMLFPTKLTSLINTLWLIDSASPETHHNNRRNSGRHKWLKTILGGVYNFKRFLFIQVNAKTYANISKLHHIGICMIK